MGGEESKLAPEELEDLVNKTGLKAKDVKNWYSGFMRDCPLGVLTKQEFLEIYKDVFPDGDASKFADRVFKAYDKDGDGKSRCWGLLFGAYLSS